MRYVIPNVLDSFLVPSMTTISASGLMTILYHHRSLLLKRNKSRARIRYSTLYLPSRVLCQLKYHLSTIHCQITLYQTKANMYQPIWQCNWIGCLCTSCDRLVGWVFVTDIECGEYVDGYRERDGIMERISIGMHSWRRRNVFDGN
jgi:hypothetical protein